MTDPTQNSRNPANSGTLSGALKEIMGKFLAGVDDMLPAVVIEYDRTENRATVRPLIRIQKTDNTLEDRAEIASVPVLNIGGGNGVLSFNIIPGDLGWIKASDRDISLFLQNETPVDVPPNTLRKHDFSDSLFIPDQFRKYTIAEEDDENAILLQTLDGSKRIAIDDESIRLTSDSQIFLEAETNTIIIGDVIQFGSWNTFGKITASVDVVAADLAGDFKLKEHKHVGSPSAPTGLVSPTGTTLPI